MNPASSEHAQALIGRAKQYASMDVTALIRKELGQASFEQCGADFRNMIEFTKRISLCSWSGVPDNILIQCVNKLEELGVPIVAMRSFDMNTSGRVVEQRDILQRNFRNMFSSVYSVIVPHLCYAESIDAGSDRYKEAVTNMASEVAAAKNDFKKELNEIKGALESEQGRMRQLVVNVEQMAQQSGVTKQAVHFKQLADRYRLVAGLWFSGALAVGVLLWIYVRDLHVPDSSDSNTLIAILFPRLVTITLLSTALIFCLKNFGALAHNLIINRHRQTALTTFTTFVSSTEDPGTKNAVLIQATQAIFAPQPSGYLKNDTEMPQVNQVTEIVRGVASKEKG